MAPNLTVLIILILYNSRFIKNRKKNPEMNLKTLKYLGKFCGEISSQNHDRRKTKKVFSVQNS